MGVTSVLKFGAMAENLESILALELFCAAQGVDFRQKIIGAEKNLGKGTQKIYNLIRSRVPFIEKDEYMKPHIDEMCRHGSENAEFRLWLKTKITFSRDLPNGRRIYGKADYIYFGGRHHLSLGGDRAYFQCSAIHGSWSSTPERRLLLF